MMHGYGDICLVTQNIYYSYTLYDHHRDTYKYIHKDIHTYIHIYIHTYIYTPTYITIHTSLHNKQGRGPNTLRTMDDSLAYTQTGK